MNFIIKIELGKSCFIFSILMNFVLNLSTGSLTVLAIDYLIYIIVIDIVLKNRPTLFYSKPLSDRNFIVGLNDFSDNFSLLHLC